MLCSFVSRSHTDCSILVRSCRVTVVRHFECRAVIWALTRWLNLHLRCNLDVLGLAAAVTYLFQSSQHDAYCLTGCTYMKHIDVVTKHP
jgi:hypothetical protein